MVVFATVLLLLMGGGIVLFCMGLAFINDLESSTEDGVSMLMIGLVLMLIVIFISDIIYPVIGG